REIDASLGHSGVGGKLGKFQLARVGRCCVSGQPLAMLDDRRKLRQQSLALLFKADRGRLARGCLVFVVSAAGRRELRIERRPALLRRRQRSLVFDRKRLERAAYLLQALTPAL